MRGRVDGAGRSCRLVRSDVVCWSLCSGFPYVAGGWRRGLPVANHSVSGSMSAARVECGIKRRCRAYPHCLVSDVCERR